MTLKLYAVCCIAITTFFSCAQKDNKNEIDESLLGPPPVVSNTSAPVTVDTSLQKVQNIQPGITGNIPVTADAPVLQNKTITLNSQAATQPVVQNKEQTALPGMNPAHGQPGHRCDISVGAPLNSKPAAPTTATTVSTIPTNVNVNTPATAQTTKPGMNPPHGQPGHRCDINVGAPLNSKPAVPTATNVTPAATIPAKVDTVKN